MGSKTEATVRPMLRQLGFEVLRLRYWQHVVNEELKKDRFTVPIHVAIGHEAIAIAVSHMCEPDDQLVLSHRNMAYVLARNGSLDSVFKEYLLESDGLGQGKAGSMNLSDVDNGVVYTSSILGNGIPVACGLALGKQMRRESGVVTVLTGDGAMEEGTFYEGLVFSKTHSLPLILIVENNDNAMSSTIADRRCPISIGDMCAAVDLPFIELRGNDVVDYREQLVAAKATVEGSGPVCIEVHLKTMTNHSGPTPGWDTDPRYVSLDDGLKVEQSSDDPVHVLEALVPSATMAELTEQVFAEEFAGYRRGEQP